MATTLLFGTRQIEVRLGAAYIAELTAGFAASADTATRKALLSAGFLTWSALSAVTGAAGDVTTVALADSGTHTDPVVGGTVDNAGRYAWSASPAGWQRTADLDSQSAADSAAAAAADRILAASSAASVADKLGSAPAAPGYLPLVVDGDHNVVLWLDGGKLGALGLSDALVAIVSAAVQLGIGFGTAPYSAAMIPLVIDGNRSVLLGLDNGKLVANGLSDSLLATIKAQVAPLFALRREPASALAPKGTDGRSLYAWRGKAARLLSGTPSPAIQAGLGVGGDSWGELTTILVQLQNRVTAEGYTLAGDGFISVDTATNAHQNAGVSMTASGWTLYDSSGGAAPPAAGCSIDGFCRYATGTTATLSVTCNAATDFAIDYSKLVAGTFRYRVDGGSWTTVNVAASGGMGTVALSGLSNASHTVDIDLTGNTGTVALLGFKAWKSGVNGVLVHKIGNAGQTGLGIQQELTNSHAAAQAAALGLDVVFFPLTTNDYKTSGATPSIAAAQMTAKAAAIRSGRADCAVVFVMPPQSDNGTVLVAQTQYRDAMYAAALSGGYEFANAYDFFGPIAFELAAGQWSESVSPIAHLSTAGAYRLDRFLWNLFLNF